MRINLSGMSSKDVLKIIEPAIMADKRASGTSCRIYGPFGLRAEASIFIKKDEDVLGWLTVVIQDAGIMYETGRSRGINYPPGSIGDLNGFDNELAPLPEDLSEIVDLVFSKKGEEA